MSSFKIKFWGCSGSIPTPVETDEIQKKIYEVLLLAVEQKIQTREEVKNFLVDLPHHLTGTYHGNTPCVQIMNNHDDDILIFDAGSGIRRLGLELSGKLKPESHIHLFMTHLHWDHIQGFPFFSPIYYKSSKITVYGCHSNMEEAFRLQQNPTNYPVQFECLPAEIKFETISPETNKKIGQFTIKPRKLPHPGDSYGYRITKDGKSVVYATDLELKDFSDKALEPFFDFFADAEYLIYDSMYTVPENYMKEDWGHSSAIIGVDMALKSNVRNLVIFHHEPTYTDEKIHELYKSSSTYRDMRKNGKDLGIITAFDGMELIIH